jgi:hypothetical protein
LHRIQYRSQQGLAALRYRELKRVFLAHRAGASSAEFVKDAAIPHTDLHREASAFLRIGSVVNAILVTMVGWLNFAQFV